MEVNPCSITIFLAAGKLREVRVTADEDRVVQITQLAVRAAKLLAVAPKQRKESLNEAKHDG